jgi:hypothetical protein
VSKKNEWELLRRQFHALTHDESAESIEDIFDTQFRLRFAELINRLPNLIAQLILSTGTNASELDGEWTR